MKYLNILLASVILHSLLACGQSGRLSQVEDETEPKIIREQLSNEGEGFAVLELFTSEGCSSCPPADRLLRDVIADSEEKGIQVFALSFHVDYWNRLGWKDPYSKAAFSERQRNYAQSLRCQVYTPQMVVNGKEEFVGSNRAKTAMALKKALSIPISQLELELEAKLEGSFISYSYQYAGEPIPAVLNLALVESNLSQDVSRGENRGHTLKHDNIVRIFESLQLDSMPGKGRLMPLTDMDLSKTRLIAYVQNAESKRVLYAEELVFM